MSINAVLAYVIVLIIGQFGPGVGSVVSIPISLVFILFPAKIRTFIGGFIVGAVGSLITITFAYYIFEWLVGKGSFKLFPFLAAVLALLPVMWKTLRSCIGMSPPLNVTDSEVRNMFAPELIGMKMTLMGSIAGIIFGGYWLLLR